MTRPLPSKLVVQIPSTLGYEATVSHFRIFVDGRFVGNLTDDEAILELPAGMHLIVVELPNAIQRRELPNGGAEVRSFTMRGEQSIKILGGTSQQTLIFNADNLKIREVPDDSGH